MIAEEVEMSTAAEEQNGDLEDRQLPVSFCEKRHVENIEGTKSQAQTWRMKERMKTVSVALVLCLNVGVDPPDVVKTSPCARLECWIDPLSMSPQKALETIGASLQKQYERWQPRARYKQSLDPTVEEVKKLCTSLRRNAKEERVLFHYTGHGVPKPTVNGEIWVFNKSYTQYIPLSIYDLQTWMSSPSIYVYDCSNASIILESFKQFQVQREQEIELAAKNRSNSQDTPLVSVKNCIQLAACGPNELLPMNPELPADLFTSCLTTPIKIALRWYVLQNKGKLVPAVDIELIDKIPGQLNDRRTMLGELNWIFTAITDTIAWNTLPRELFQKLFRQDLLVASLFRNFLLAERIMRSYNCTPHSSPKLPPTYQHPMWQAWDLTLDLCLSQMPGILEEGASFKHSPFFAEQLTAFQVWVSYGSDVRSPPEQLPIVLQVLLSQVHRLRALELLGRFLDLGPWAVSLALSVGIFPYVLKLLQSSARELRNLLVFIWAKIMAVDSSCQADLVKDNGHKYFLSVLSDSYMPAEHRTMAAFVLAMIVNNYKIGQEATLQGSLIATCLDQLTDEHDLLRQWLTLCLAKVWTKFDPAKWVGVRDCAHEKMYELLQDNVPEVRASAVFALGAFVNNSSERGDHANNIDHNVGMNLISVVSDGSPLVRQELVVALAGLVAQFENQFAVVAHQFLEEERQRDQNNPMVAAVAPDVTLSTFTSSGMRRSSSKPSIKGMLSLSPTNQMLLTSPGLNYSSGSGSSFESSGSGTEATPVPVFERMKRVASTSSITGMVGGSYGNVYTAVWKALLQLVVDPHPKVADLAKTLVNSIKLKATVSAIPKQVIQRESNSHSAPSSPSNRPAVVLHLGESPPPRNDHVPELRKFHKKTNLDSKIDKDFLKPEFHPEIRRGSLQVSSAKPYLNNQRRGSQDSRTSVPDGASLAEAMQANSVLPTTYSTQFSRSRKLFDKGPSVVADEEPPVLPDKNALPVSTELFEWCCKYFAQPVMRVPADQDIESARYHEKEFGFLRNAQVRKSATYAQDRAGFSRLDDQVFINRNTCVPTAVKFHPYEPYLAVSDREGISIWELGQGTRIDYFQNHNPKHSRITMLDFINSHEKAMLLVGSDDGAVRIWKDYCKTGERPELVTSWQALSDMLPSNRGSGLVADWAQQTGSLLVSGDVRTIKVWDTQRETKIQDIPTGADSCVTSLASDAAGKSLVIAGCGDGSVRLYDRRLAPNECRVMTLREHSGWVINVHLQRGVNGKIISGSVGGDIRFWDPRFTESVKVINTAQHLTSFQVHPYADVLACGYLNQVINVFNQSGDNLSTIKYHEGFMGQRIGPISCMSFHPYKVKLAAGSTDGFISVYSTPDTRKR
ncbi:regulatory-associated protein of mTOR-like isoform X2 [Lineus longissimus]|uniref:regulatory-associated protein of mTOR-like isoform X2 n=1 Tax=Lineus longissimus TaxID=88925 RepID=UPI00315D9942